MVEGFVLIQHIVVGDEVDAARHILQRGVGLETYIGREAFLSFLHGHASRQGDEYVGALAHGFLDEEHLPHTIAVELQRAGQDFGRMALVIEVEHEALQGLQGILHGAVVVVEGGTMGCPYGQIGLHVFVALQDESASFGQLGVTAHLLELGAGDGTDRGFHPCPVAGKECFLVHAWFSLRVR